MSLRINVVKFSSKLVLYAICLIVACLFSVRLNASTTSGYYGAPYYMVYNFVRPKDFTAGPFSSIG